ncbi:unnamed protein product [Prunus armeniaca]
MDLQKGSQPIDSYLRHAKSLVDSLDAINQTVSSKELITAHHAPRISPDQNTALMATQSSPHTTGHTSFPSHRGGGFSSNRRSRGRDG